MDNLLLAGLIQLLRRAAPRAPRARRSVAGAKISGVGAYRRALAFESCEDRSMLAGGSIAGVKYEDLTGAGFGPTNVPLGGVTINLYSDTNADGMLDAGDALDASTVTATGTGAYSFTGLADGTYFVQETVPANSTQTGGPSYYTVDVIGGQAFTPTMDTIDDFAAPSPASTYAISLSNPNPTVVNQSEAGILGGGRNTLVSVINQSPGFFSATGFIGDTGGTDAFDLGTDTTTPGTAVTLQYDGTATDTVTGTAPNYTLTNAMGLNNDLTDGGTQNGILMEFPIFQADQSTINVTINATSAGGTATYTMAVPSNNSNSSADPFAAFSSFTTTGTFSWTDITSLNFVINGTGAATAIDLQLGSIVTADLAPTGYNFANYSAAGSISGETYVDTNANGVLDTGEPPISGVEIILTGTTIADTAVDVSTTTNAAGLYSFTGVLPGTYTITEVQPSNFTPYPGSGVLTVGLTAGETSTGNNFGQLGLDPAYVSKREFLYPIVIPTSFAAVYPTAPVVTEIMLAAASSGSSSGAANSASSTQAIMTPAPAVPWAKFAEASVPNTAAPSLSQINAAAVSAALATSAAAEISAASVSSGMVSTGAKSTSSDSSATPTTDNSTGAVAGTTASVAASSSSVTSSVKKGLV